MNATGRSMWRTLWIMAIAMLTGLLTAGGVWSATTGATVYNLERSWPPQFSSPVGTAADGSGHVYVADQGSHRILKLDAVSGAVLAAWGSSGSGTGQFNSPSGVAVDSSGNVYVTDWGNHRIQKFAADGTFLYTWGSQGSGDGQFIYPYGIAVDSGGNVYVADYYNHRIQKFAADGTFLFTWGSNGSGDGQFSYPAGVTVDSGGTVFVTDQSNHRIQKFKASDGSFVGVLGLGYGSGDGQFNYPSGIAVDSGSNVYVTDSSNYRIQKFNAAGDWVYASGSYGSSDGQFTGPNGIAVDSGGHLFVADNSNYRIQKLTAIDGTFQATWGYNGGGSDLGQFNLPMQATVDSSGNVYVADAANNRVQKFAANGTYLLSFGAGYGSGDGQFYDLVGVAVDSSGNVYATDLHNSRVQKFAPDGTLFSSWSSFVNVSSPYGIAVDKNGYGYVVEPWNGRIVKFNATDGTFVGSIGSGSGSGDGQLIFPTAVAVGSNGDVYIADSGNSRIQKFNAAGDWVLSFGSSGSGDGQFNGIYAITVDSEGHLFVADTGNNRIQVFDPTGGFLTAWGTIGSGLRVGSPQFNGPQGIAVDNGGNVYVVDTNNNRVQKFNPRSDLYVTTVQTVPPNLTIIVDGTTYTAPQTFNWAPGSSHTIATVANQDNGSGTRYLFDNWSDAGTVSHTVTAPAANATYTATFATQYQLTTYVPTGGGTITPDSGNWYYAGTVVPIQATANLGSVFNYWSGSVDVPGSAASFITMSGPQTVWAYFSADTTNVTIQTSPPGLGIIVDGTPATAPQTYSWTPGSSHTIATTTPQSGPGGALFAFATWSDGGTIRHTITAPAAGSSATYTANFTLAEGGRYLLERAWPPNFVSPFGAAGDGNGHLFVADTYNNRIQKLDAASGAVLAVWGSYGSGKGQFNYPFGVAVDGIGNVYVADTNNNRIQKFSADGTFQFEWGSFGASDGQFYYPEGIAVDSSGRVFVADAYNHRIQRFSAGGVFQLAWGIYGSEAGQFSYPQGIAVDSHGMVYVTDSSNNRIQKFTTDGAYQLAWGGSGSGDGQFNNPWGIAVQNGAVPGGELIYVTDQYNNRIQKFSADGTFLLTWGSSGSGDGQFSSPMGLAVDNRDHVYVAEFGNSRIQKFAAADGTFQAAWGLSGSGNSAGSSPGQFNYPFGTAVDKNGNVYVADIQNNRIQKFSTDGKFLFSWGSFGYGDGQLYNPYGVTVDSGDNVYVTEIGNHRLQMFAADGTFLSAIGGYGSGDGQFNYPHGVAIANNGDIYVADTYNHRVQKFAANGTFLGYIGFGYGSGDGQFYYPQGIAVTSGGTIYVADSYNHRIQKFGSDGIFQLAWGNSGDKAGQFSYPTGVALDSSGNVYVTDYGNNRMQKFDSAGNYQTTWGAQGSGLGNGMAQFSGPIGVAVDAGFNVYVTDHNNHRVQKFNQRNDLAPITIQTNPPGLSIIVDGMSYTAPQTFDWVQGSQHMIDTPSPQNVGSYVRQTFASWSDGGANNHMITVPTAAATYTATFGVEYQLFTGVDKGLGSVTPTSGTWYPAGSTVTLQANADPGFQFVNWLYGPVADPLNAHTTITMDQWKNAYAVFKQNVTIQTSPPGLAVDVDGTTYTAPHTFAWDPYSDHYIGTTSPQNGTPGTRYIFNNWSNGGAITHYVHIDPAFPSYTASFDTQYQITTTAGPHGSITPSGSWFYAGTDVTVQITPDPGYHLDDTILLDGVVHNVTDAERKGFSHTFTSIAAPHTVSATFVQDIPQTLVISNIPQIYSGVAKTAAVSCSGGGTVSNIRNATQTNAGTYAVLADCAAYRGIYAPGTDLSANFIINPATLTVTATGVNKIYDGTTVATVILSDNHIGSDAVTTAYTSASFANKHVGTDKTVSVTGISITGGAAAGNYTLGNTTAASTANITVRALTVSAQPNSKSYDGATGSATNALLTGGSIADGDTAPTWTQSYDTRNVGAGKTLTPDSLKVNDGNGGNNYSYLFISATVGVITAQPLTVTAATASKQYDGNTSSAVAPTITAGTLQGGDTATFIQTYDTRNVGTSKTMSPAGTVNDGNNGNNYSYTFTSANVGTITAKAVTITSPAVTPKVYDKTTMAAITGTLSGVVNPDVVTLNGTGTFAGVTVGTGIAVTSTATLGGADAGNYTLTQPVGLTGAITPKALTVISPAVTPKVYDKTATATITGTLNGVLNPDSVTLIGVGASASVNVGTGIAVTSMSTLGGADAGNYTLTQPASLTGAITARPVTVTADTKSKNYGAVDPALTYQVTSGSVVAGDTFSGTLTRVVGEAPGTYPIQQGTLALSANYTLSYVGANLTISTPTFTITNTAEANGNITPTTTVIYGTSLTVSATPNTGYHLVSVLVDGVNQTISNPKSFSVTFSAIKANHTVMAIFDIDSANPVKNGGSFYTALADAYLVANSGDVIQSMVALFTGGMTLNRNISVIIKGGYESSFSTQPGYTVVQGGVTVVKGKLVADRMVIR